MLRSKYYFFFFFVLGLVSCDSDRVFDEYKSVSNEWDKDEVVSFTLNAPDTINNYNLFINLRNTDAYEFSNLFLVAELNFPNGKTIKDTLEYRMAKADGTFLGTGFSDIKENKLWYKGYEEPFFFAEPGAYHVSIQHAMRKNGEVYGVEKLKGVTDIGLRVEHVNPN